MDTTMTAALLTWAETHPALVDSGGAQLPVLLEDLPADGTDGVMLSTLVGEPYVRRYKSGGYIASYPFGLWLRVNGGDTASRLDAMKVLGDVASSIEGGEDKPASPDGYEVQGVELRTPPVKVAAGESGSEDYQVTFEMTYRKRG